MGEPVHQSFDGNPRLQAGQMSAEAEMGAVGEGQVPSGVRAADFEPLGIFEDRGVPVRSGDGYRDLVTGPDPGLAGRRCSGRNRPARR